MSDEFNEVIGNYIKKLKNSQDIKNAFKNLKDESLFAVFLNLNISTFLVFRLLSKYKISYFINSGASIFLHPQWLKRSFSKRVKTFLNKDRRSMKEYFQNMFLRIFPLKLLGISDVPIYFKDCKTEDMKIRNELYKVYIGPVFDEMVDNIVFTYKFTTLPNCDELRDECKIWLTPILDKYDQSKGSKETYIHATSIGWKE